VCTEVTIEPPAVDIRSTDSSSNQTTRAAGWRESRSSRPNSASERSMAQHSAQHSSSVGGWMRGGSDDTLRHAAHPKRRQENGMLNSSGRGLAPVNGYFSGRNGSDQRLHASSAKRAIAPAGWTEPLDGRPVSRDAQPEHANTPAKARLAVCATSDRLAVVVDGLRRLWDRMSHFMGLPLAGESHCEVQDARVQAGHCRTDTVHRSAGRAKPRQASPFRRRWRSEVPRDPRHSIRQAAVGASPP
jgi:hypothetical protein